MNITDKLEKFNGKYVRLILKENNIIVFGVIQGLNTQSDSGDIIGIKFVLDHSYSNNTSAPSDNINRQVIYDVGELKDIHAI